MKSIAPVVVYLRPARLIAVRATGSYEQSIPRAWDELNGLLQRNGLYAAAGKGFGLAHDNPGDVGAQNCRYDACVPLDANIEKKRLDNVDVTTLPGGAYACTRLTGSYDLLRGLIANLHRDFEPLAGTTLDKSRPVVTVYVDNPSRNAQSDLRAEVCVPVIADDVRDIAGA